MVLSFSCDNIYSVKYCWISPNNLLFTSKSFHFHFVSTCWLRKKHLTNCFIRGNGRHQTKLFTLAFHKIISAVVIVNSNYFIIGIHILTTRRVSFIEMYSWKWTPKCRSANKSTFVNCCRYNESRNLNN